MRRYIMPAVVGGIAGGLVVALAFLVLGNGPRTASGPAPVEAAAPSGGPTHEDMHRMMDSVHGEGTSQRMHEAMGPDAEKMMDQCTAMMAMMTEMQDMMSGSGTGMMGGQNGDSMPDTMRRMMPQSGLY